MRGGGGTGFQTTQVNFTNLKFSVAQVGSRNIRSPPYGITRKPQNPPFAEETPFGRFGEPPLSGSMLHD